MGMNELELLHVKFKTLMSEYASVYDRVKKEKNWKDPFRDIISKDIPNLLKNCAKITSPYIVEGSYGKGLWTAVPWIAIFDSRITTSAQKGVYIVYLLNKDSKELYLTFEIAATEVMGTKTDSKGNAIFTGVVGNNNPKVKKALRDRANIIRNELKNDYFSADDNIETGSSGYDNGAIYYRKYTLSDLPDGEELIVDLKKMLSVYRDYYEAYYAKDEEWQPSLEEYDSGISKDKWLELLPGIVEPASGEVLAMFYTERYGTTYYTLAEKFAFHPPEINQRCTQLARRVQKETNCPVLNKGDKDYYWPILFLKRDASPEDKEADAWKLRPELYDALTEFNILRFLPGKEVKKPFALTAKEAIDRIKSYISFRGFTYPGSLVENFYLSLKSKPFTILAGTSGTGKTRLVKLFAEAINANYKMVPVRPDWSDSSDLFGHVDLNGQFVTGAVLEFIAEAQANPSKPYILCLDEMNLARVEYYLSDFLSVIETREVKDGKIISDPLVTSEKYGMDAAAKNKYGEIRFPQNLYLVGTVNMDETTFPFSKKVLDRANTIEFDYVDLNSIQNTDDAKVDSITAPNSFLETRYLFLKQCMDEDPQFVKDVCDELQKINVVLQKANAHVGYRVRDEIVFYLMNNKKAGLISDEEALDNEIMQKILPRIQGSSVSVKDMLCELFKILAGDYEGYQTKNNDVASKMKDKLDKKGAEVKYPKSARKAAFMVRRFEEDGFTSYWL